MKCMEQEIATCNEFCKIHCWCHDILPSFRQFGVPLFTIQVGTQKLSIKTVVFKTERQYFLILIISYRYRDPKPGDYPEACVEFIR
jgi:hypothetical protein